MTEKTNLNQLADYLVDTSNKKTFLLGIQRNMWIVDSLSSDRWKEKALPKIKALGRAYIKSNDILMLDKMIAMGNRSSKSDYLMQIETQMEANLAVKYTCELRPKKYAVIDNYPSVENINNFSANLGITHPSDKQKKAGGDGSLIKLVPCSKIVIRLEGNIGKEGVGIIIKEILGTYKGKSYFCLIYPNNPSKKAEYTQGTTPKIYVPKTNIQGDTHPISLTEFKKRDGIFHNWAWDKLRKTFLLKD